jgi:peroxiredoxin Q/BCP
LGASFDSVADQKKFAEAEGFPYPLLSDPDKVMGAAYDAVRQEGEKYFEAGIPRRISYLIDPGGKIAKAYDVEGDGLDLDGHAQAILADIGAAS